MKGRKKGRVKNIKNMGQYFKLINEDKKEVVNAWDLGGGAKFFEWLYNREIRVLAWLLRRSNVVGGGDIEKYETLGRWAGDRISLVGDYDKSGLYDEEKTGFTDISKLLKEEFNDALKREGTLDEFGLFTFKEEENKRNMNNHFKNLIKRKQKEKLIKTGIYWALVIIVIIVLWWASAWIARIDWCQIWYDFSC